jgi:hypothetical protein
MIIEMQYGLLDLKYQQFRKLCPTLLIRKSILEGFAQALGVFCPDGYGAGRQ